jgi:hypothetical protein
MDGANGPKETTLGVNVFTAPGKTMVGERPKPFGEAFGFDPITSDFNLRRVRRGAGRRNDDGAEAEELRQTGKFALSLFRRKNCASEDQELEV